jgi:hypothetical protein
MFVIALDINLGETYAGPAWKHLISMLEIFVQGIFPVCNMVMVASSRSTLPLHQSGCLDFRGQLTLQDASLSPSCTINGQINAVCGPIHSR